MLVNFIYDSFNSFLFFKREKEVTPTHLVFGNFVIMLFIISDRARDENNPGLITHVCDLCFWVAIKSQLTVTRLVWNFVC